MCAYDASCERKVGLMKSVLDIRSTNGIYLDGAMNISGIVGRWGSLEKSVGNDVG
jgi:hypothetical protein